MLSSNSTAEGQTEDFMKKEVRAPYLGQQWFVDYIFSVLLVTYMVKGNRDSLQIYNISSNLLFRLVIRTSASVEKSWVLYTGNTTQISVL